MARNVDLEALKKLGYSADPIPGDPLSIADAVQYLSALAKKADAASTKLAGLVKEGADAPLVGESATELRKRFGIEAAQVMLGHRTLDVTELYAEKNIDAAKRIAAQVG